MVIVGAKGLAKELLTVFQWHGDATDLVFFDNVNTDTPDFLYDQFLVLKSWDALQTHFKSNSNEFVLGIGGANARQFLAEKCTALGGKLSSIVSNHALIGEFGNVIGDGVAILSHATITGDVNIGDGTLINKAAIISHDAKVGRYCEISPGAKILGRATVGDRSEIGTNAVILPDVTIGSDCKVGAGAVVTKNIPNGFVVVGVPARPLQKTPN